MKGCSRFSTFTFVISPNLAKYSYAWSPIEQHYKIEKRNIVCDHLRVQGNQITRHRCTTFFVTLLGEGFITKEIFWQLLNLHKLIPTYKWNNIFNSIFKYVFYIDVFKNLMDHYWTFKNVCPFIKFTSKIIIRYLTLNYHSTWAGLAATCLMIIIFFTIYFQE